MRVYVIDTKHMAQELRGGLIGVVGSEPPTAGEKQECVEAVARYAADGWAIAGNPDTAIGRLDVRTARAAGVPFVWIDQLADLDDRSTQPTFLPSTKQVGRTVR